jgi:glycosyltransferase involved in cell wall biosynthesis
MQAFAPFFSVITPTYNRRASLAWAIRSVQRQNFQNYEHIIVDDASTDGTSDYVLGIHDPKIRFFRFEQWQGANACRNEGIELSRSRWLSFLDSDDEYLPNRLQSIWQAIDQHPTTELILSSFVTQKLKSTKLSSNPEAVISGKQLEQAVITSSLLLAGSSISVNRSTILRSGGYSTTIRRLQDREALLKLSRVCSARIRSEVDWIKNVSEDSISRSRTGYIDSWNEVLTLHPALASEYREQIGGHVSRHLLTSFLRGNVRSVLEILRTNSNSPLLRFGPLSMLICLAKSRVKRRGSLAKS